MHGTAYGSLNWRDRAKERKRRAEELNDTLAAYCRFYWRVRASDLVLRRYGIRLIANDRVFHVSTDKPRRLDKSLPERIFIGITSAPAAVPMEPSDSAC